MMHGHEKSRSAIVAVKPTNKAERSAAEQSAAEPTAAESVERRAETKGNVDQQRTRRTQRRISVLEPGGQEVIARAGNYEICKAAFDKALFVYPTQHIELRQGARVICKSKEG